LRKFKERETRGRRYSSYLIILVLLQITPTTRKKKRLHSLNLGDPDYCIFLLNISHID